MRPSNPIESNAKKVNRYLGAKIGGKPDRLYEAAVHLIVHGGKRLRPYMVVRSCQLLGGTATEAMPAAGAVEMIHNFTLVHDDIMDNDDMRHGVQTVHKMFGTPVAILAGDVLYSKAYQTIADSGMQPQRAAILVSRLAKGMRGRVRGPVLGHEDVRGGEDPDAGRVHYDDSQKDCGPL